MKKLIFALLISVGFGACSDPEPDLHMGQQLEYNLFKSSEFEYNGTKQSFEQMKTFDGHVKIHLANEPPDYSVILVEGNVGGNFSAEVGFDASKIAV